MLLVSFAGIAVIIQLLELWLQKYRKKFLENRISIYYINFPKEINIKDFGWYLFTYGPAFFVSLTCLSILFSFLELVNAYSFSLFLSLIFIALYSVANLIITPVLSINGLRPPAEKLLPIHNAVSKGDFALTKKLVQHGHNVNRATNKNHTPLYIAVENNFIEIARLLIQNGANVNFHRGSYRNETIMQLATAKGHHNIVDLLVRNGASPLFHKSDIRI